MSKLDEAFVAVPRKSFLPSDQHSHADWDMPLPIGYGQTNSQPYTVKLMLGWLDVRAGQKLLDVGSGSGWTSALLSHLAGQKGKVIAVEVVPELVAFGRNNCAKLGLVNIEFHEAGKTIGWPEEGPYDRILVSAAANHVPTELLDQLREGGRMVIPVRDTMYVVHKSKQGEISREEYPGFAFVPLV